MTSTALLRADRNRRGGDRRPQPLDHRLELLVVPDLVEQHAELLAAPPRGHVTRTRGVLEAARDLAQHEVADLMPLRVVDALEVVDVDERDRRPRGGAGQAHPQYLREMPAVEQFREGVHAREPLQPAQCLGTLVLGMPLCGDVTDRAREQHAPVDHPDGCPVADPARHAVDADETVLLLHDRAVAPDEVGEAPVDVEVGAIVGVDELVVVVDELLHLGRRAQQRREARAMRVHGEPLVGKALATVEVLADDLGRVGERRAGRSRLGDQRCALGDVLDHHDRAFRVRA